MNPVVFDNTQGRLADLHGTTVGVAVLAVDPGVEIPGTVHYLSELTGPSGWEVEGDEYTRATTGLRFTLEDSAGVVRYLTTPPTFDLTGVPTPNAVVFFDTAGIDDDAHEVLFLTPVEEGPGFAGWSPDEPERGLARVGRVVPVLGLVGGDGVTIDSTDPQRPVVSAAGGVEAPAVTAPSPLRGWSWGLSATEQAAPRDLSGGGRHARWGSGEFDIANTRIAPADGPRLLHWQTEDEDPPDFLGASTAPVDWTSSNTWFISAAWRSIDPWHTDTYPQSLGCVQGGNGSGPDEIIEVALGISENGQIRLTGHNLANNDFGELGQFNPAAGVEVAALIDQAAGTIKAYTRSNGAWVQVGATLTKPEPIELTNDSFESGIHKFATGYGKGWQSYCALAPSIDATPVRRFDAADAVAAGTSPGDTWAGSVDGQTWLLGEGADGSDGGRIRTPAIYATGRAAWALGAGSAALTAPAPDPETDSWSMAVSWTPRSLDRDDTLIHQLGPGPSLRRADGAWSLVLASPLADGTLLAEDSGAFGATTDGAGTLDPLAVTTVDAGGGVTVQIVDPGTVPDRDVTVVADTIGDVIISAFVAPDFSAAVWALFGAADGNVVITDGLGTVLVAAGRYVPAPGQRLGIRVIGDQAAATVDGVVVASGTTATPATGFSGVTLLPGGAEVSGFRLREADTIAHPTAPLGTLTDGKRHTLVSVVDQDAGTWRVRIDGTDLNDLPTPPADITSGLNLLLAPAVHQDLHDIGIDLSVIPDIEIAAIEALT